MSTNTKTEFRNGFTRNFTSQVIDRYIIIDDECMNDSEKDEFIRKVNESLWEHIQEVNMICPNILLPFVHVKRVFNDGDKLRIVMNDFDTTKTVNDYPMGTSADLDKLSHLVVFKQIPARRLVVVSDNCIPGNARILIDESDQITAAVDIMLDIAMFNSMSFLKVLSDTDKRDFSRLKYEYYLKHHLYSYYDIDYSDTRQVQSYPPYFSFAFHARQGHKMNYYKYELIWENFIATQFPNIKNKNPLPEEMLSNFHVEKGSLEKKYFDRSFWSEQAPGAYLLLRINRKPNDTERIELLERYFGISPFYVGATKLVPLSEYFSPFLNMQLRDLYVSAFKIIV